MTLTIDHPLVKLRRKKWETRPNRRLKITMGFEELFDAFQSDCITQTQIALLNSVSRERIRQIYNNWFADLFDDKKGLDRLKACSIIKRAVVVEKLSKVFPKTPWKQEIFTILKSKNFEIKSQVFESTYAAKASSFLVNGKNVKLRKTHCHLSTLGKFFGRMIISMPQLKALDFIIMRFSHDDEITFFVIPVTDLLTVLNNRKKIPCLIYIGPTPAQQTMFDFWKYHNAWHLLEESQ